MNFRVELPRRQKCLDISGEVDGEIPESDAPAECEEGTFTCCGALEISCTDGEYAKESKPCPVV